MPVPWQWGRIPRCQKDTHVQRILLIAVTGLIMAADNDAVENALKRKVCADAMSLAAARAVMAADWRRGAAFTRR